MNPNLEIAAEKAVETVLRFNLNTRKPDPLPVLEQLNNVYLISHDFPVSSVGGNQDAITLVNKAESGLQFIVMYNRTIDPFALRIALARELGHIILNHDGSTPEEEWSAEANCFAYHFLCPMIKTKKINYRPLRVSLSWEMKESIVFESIEEMKMHIADEKNRFNRFIGKNRSYNADDVDLVKKQDDRQIGWKNCYDIVLDGKIIGHCGE